MQIHSVQVMFVIWIIFPKACSNLIVVVLNDVHNILNVVEIFFYTIGAFDQLKQNATKARIPFYGR